LSSILVNKKREDGTIENIIDYTENKKPHQRETFNNEILRIGHASKNLEFYSLSPHQIHESSFFSI